ncbi:STM4015 family protein [Streptomyces sp. NPDC057621]|uniref:STM4015 family protein n=1 Tax=Streptomyces sp. NPDC057621 TaxID=3346186 RepID=UPI0036AAB831
MKCFDNHLKELFGLPALLFPQTGEAAGLVEPGAVAWRIGYPRWEVDEELWNETFDRFCAEIDVTQVRALIAGNWGDMEDTDSSEVVAALLAAREQLPALRALFLGDITEEECKFSRIHQSDVSPLLAAFPALEEFGMRAGVRDDQGQTGGTLQFPALRHDALRRLIVQSCELPYDIVRGVAASDLPALEHLELWLGSEEYGFRCEVTDLEDILSGTRLPRLRHLALSNSDLQDDIAAAVASAPVVAQLEVLDLSKGTLGDEGAAALLSGQPLTHLKKLDLHHNFISKPFRQRLRETLEPAGVHVNLGTEKSDKDETNIHEDRYICLGALTHW